MASEAVTQAGDPLAHSWIWISADAPSADLSLSAAMLAEPGQNGEENDSLEGFNPPQTCPSHRSIRQENPSAPTLPAEAQGSGPQPELLSAPLVSRLGAAALDALLVTVGVGFTLAIAALAFGADEFSGVFGRGFDFVLDGLLIRRKLALILLALSSLFFTLYSTLSHAVFGKTLGKHLLGLSVQNQLGTPPSFRDSFWRCVFSSFFTTMACIGPAWLMLDPTRRGLHDRLVGTRVFQLRKS